MQNGKDLKMHVTPDKDIYTQIWFDFPALNKISQIVYESFNLTPGLLL